MSEKQRVYFVPNSENGTPEGLLSRLRAEFSKATITRSGVGITQQIKLNLIGQDPVTIIWDKGSDPKDDDQLRAILDKPTVAKLFITRPLENIPEELEQKVTQVTSLDELISKKLLGE